MLESEPNVIKSFDQTHAVSALDLKCDVETARTCDALSRQIDSEWGGTIHRQDALFERLCILRWQHDRQQSVLQAVLAKNVSKASGHDDAYVVCQHSPYRRLAR